MFSEFFRSISYEIIVVADLLICYAALMIVILHLRSPNIRLILFDKSKPINNDIEREF